MELQQQTNKTKKNSKWTAQEDEMLEKLVKIHGHKWALIASQFRDKKPNQIAGHWEKCLDPMIARGPFTDEEDEIVKKYVEENGAKNWPRLANIIKNRSSKQCRERWFNHLDPHLYHDPWTIEEDLLICKMFEKYGSKWAIISKNIPGRADNSVKNRYYSSISKRIQYDINGEVNLLPDTTTRRPRRSKLFRERPAESSNNNKENKAIPPLQPALEAESKCWRKNQPNLYNVENENEFLIDDDLNFFDFPELDSEVGFQDYSDFIM